MKLLIYLIINFVGIGYIVGIPARTTLKTGGGVDTAIDSALVLAQS